MFYFNNNISIFKNKILTNAIKALSELTEIAQQTFNLKAICLYTISIVQL